MYLQDTLLDPAAVFRDVMAGVCTPVAVITALDGDRPHGTTVSAFASLSVDPPMVLVSLARSSELLGLIRRTGTFGVNVLGSDQRELAAGFARKGQSKFDGVQWSEEWAVPRIAEVAGWLACEVRDLVPGGDHVVALGNVVAAATTDAAPLTYHRRAFGTHAAFAMAGEEA
jgi:flavin reductase (DIM6/NTAB) family NADH-FMN oxidoreductase RutF